ncbi:MAG: hypothetical protein AAF135_26425, partial [Bacteroidota bacterium]
MIQRRIALIYLICFPLFCLHLQAQFIAHYEYNKFFETVRDVRQTLDGGYIMLGDWLDYTSPSFQEYHLYLTKTDPWGEVQWTRVYQGGDFDGSFYKGGRLFP